MARAVKAAEVAGQEPTIDDGFRREFRLIQVTRHHGLAANRNFADAVGGRIYDAHFHPGQRLANRVRAKRFQIVDRDRRAGFREPIPVGDGDPEIVEKLERLRLGKCTADNNSVELSAKRFMDLLEQAAADSEAWPAPGECLVDSYEHIEDFSFARRQRVEASL